MKGHFERVLVESRKGEFDHDQLLVSQSHSQLLEDGSLSIEDRESYSYVLTEHKH